MMTVDSHPEAVSPSLLRTWKFGNCLRVQRMKAGAGFCRTLRHFSRSVRMDMSAHFSALNGEEFFVVERSGWRGRRESDFQVFCHPNEVHACSDVDKHIRVRTTTTTTPHPHTHTHAHTPSHTLSPSPPPPHPPPPPPPPKAQTGLVIVCFELLFTVPFVVDMPLHGGHAAGAAMWRRQRRLRSWLRHERMTVAMTLAEMTHHTAPREPKMARVGEVEEQVTHAGLRAQQTPPPGERPGILPEPLSQRSDHSRRHFSGDGLPQLAMPSLAGAAGEAVDAAALAFLLSQSLAAKEHEDRNKRGGGEGGPQGVEGAPQEGQG